MLVTPFRCPAGADSVMQVTPTGVAHFHFGSSGTYLPVEEISAWPQ
jgi:hypothetical protein